MRGSGAAGSGGPPHRSHPGPAPCFPLWCGGVNDKHIEGRGGEIPSCSRCQIPIYIHHEPGPRAPRVIQDLGGNVHLFYKESRK